MVVHICTLVCIDLNIIILNNFSMTSFTDPFDILWLLDCRMNEYAMLKQKYTYHIVYMLIK